MSGEGSSLGGWRRGVLPNRDSEICYFLQVRKLSASIAPECQSISIEQVKIHVVTIVKVRQAKVCTLVFHVTCGLVSAKPEVFCKVLGDLLGVGA
jgi:hypothetical protein